MTGTGIIQLIIAFLLVCVLTWYTQQGQPYGVVVFAIAAVVGCLGFFAGDDV